MQDMKRLLKYLGPYRKDMLIGALLIFVETCFELFIPGADCRPSSTSVSQMEIFPTSFQRGYRWGFARSWH